MNRPLQYLQFSGKEEDFALWQERFAGFCFTKKVLKVLNGTDAGTDNKKYELWYSVVQYRNTYLIQCLDNRSILMLTNDCNGDGPKAWQLLRDYFNSNNTEVDEPIGEIHNLAIGAHRDHGWLSDWAEYYSEQLELPGAKVSENMIFSIVLKGLPSEKDYFKTVHDFSKDKASFAELKKTYKNFESSRTLQTARQLAMKMLLCYSKELVRKVPRVNLKRSLGSVGVTVKRDWDFFASWGCPKSFSFTSGRRWDRTSCDILKMSFSSWSFS